METVGRMQEVSFGVSGVWLKASTCREPLCMVAPRGRMHRDLPTQPSRLIIDSQRVPHTLPLWN